ncbi:MAG TPA: hypothetical protein VEW93_00105 [Acidimicrobiales bacterium]|nr:hypothetical protein [Acidimicrobiales bacterium]
MIQGLRDLITQTHELLDGRGVPHAFGGAIALGYHAESRATLDADVNIFVGKGDVREVVAAFTDIDMHPEADASEWLLMAGVRLVHTELPLRLDLFFSLDDSYEQVRERIVSGPFGPDGGTIPILSVEDLTTFKLSFNRPKDWMDLSQLVEHHPTMDIDQIEHMLGHLRGPTMAPRIARLRALLRQARP